MNILINIIVITISVLMLAMGVLFLFGAVNKEERKRAFWFLIAMIGGVVWSLASAGYLQHELLSDKIVIWLLYGIFGGAILAGLGLLGYSIIRNKAGYSILIIASIFNVLTLLLPLYDYNLLSSITRGELNWVYIIYMIVVVLDFIITVTSLVIRVATSTTNQNRNSVFLLSLGLTCTLIISLFFNMALPFLLGVFDFLWVGPLSIYLLVIGFYLNLFSMHRVSLKSVWLKRVSYAVIMFSAIILYFVIVFLTSTFIFSTIEDLTLAIIIFTICLTVTLLVMVYIVFHMTANVRSLLLVNKIDVAYILDKVGTFYGRNRYQRIAAFLADHLHLSYCGIIIGNHLYGSRPIAIGATDVNDIVSSGTNNTQMWQKPSLKLSYKMLELDIAKIAAMRNSGGATVGQILLGRPYNKINFSREDLLIIGMIVDFVSESLTKK